MAFFQPFSPSAPPIPIPRSPSRAPTGQDPHAQLGTPGRRHLHTEPLPQRHAALLLHATGQTLGVGRVGGLFSGAGKFMEG